MKKIFFQQIISRNAFLPKSFFRKNASWLIMQVVVFFSLFSLNSMLAQDLTRDNFNTDSDDTLIDQYIQSKGQKAFTFDASNIKQYWIENNVISRDNFIELYLSTSSGSLFESSPLNIKLKNVNKHMNCSIEMIVDGDTSDFYCEAYNMLSERITSNKGTKSFLQYQIISIDFNLKDIDDNSFYLIFSSRNISKIRIKKIVLLFSENINGATEEFIFTVENYIQSSQGTTIEFANDNEFSMTGKKSSIYGKTSIPVLNRSFSLSAKILNTGETASRIYIGYAVYTDTQERITPANYPYKNNDTVLTVLSSEANMDTIIVDTYTDWTKNCSIAIDAKDDLSDIPNMTILKEKILDFKKIDDSKAIITLDKAITAPIKIGSKIRIHGATGPYLYTNTKVLQPSEEAVFTSTVEKDEYFLEYSSKAFSRGVKYIRPLIFSFSLDSEQINSIKVKEYSIKY